MTIKTIAFEWMHRTWKWTQINKLKKYLEEIWKKVFVIRWDWSRTWINNDKYYDPESKYFKEFTKNKSDKNIEDWQETSNRMQRELAIWKKKYSRKNEDAIILVDRSVISRASLDWDTSEETLLKYTDWSWKEKNRLLPDIIFLLEADTNTLLKRFWKYENDEQSNMRRKNIKEKNDQYKEIIEKLPNEITKRIKTIDASQKSDEIFEIVKEKIKELI